MWRQCALFSSALQAGLLVWSRPKSVKASPRQCTQSAQDFIQIGSNLVVLYTNAWTPSKRAVKSLQYLAEAVKPSFEPNKDEDLRSYVLGRQNWISVICSMFARFSCCLTDELTETLATNCVSNYSSVFFPTAHASTAYRHLFTCCRHRCRYVQSFNLKKTLYESSTVAQIAKRFEPNTVLWAFHAIQPSSWHLASDPKLWGTRRRFLMDIDTH